jgi:hypothetical protein
MPGSWTRPKCATVWSADNAKDAIAVSASASEGWKLTLFVLGLVVSGITLTFTLVTQATPMPSPP